MIYDSIDESDCPAKFLVQRQEYPEWWAGWNEHNLPRWTSNQGDAQLVRVDELVETLTRLKKYKPTAAIYSMNNITEWLQRTI